MQYFVQLAMVLDPTLLLMQLAHHRELWDTYPFRTAPAQSPHREASDILLRCQNPDGDDPRECLWYPAWHILNMVHEPVWAIIARIRVLRVGRVLITRLAPGKQIYPHADIGKRADGYMDHEPYWSRLHWCLDGDEGSTFTAGDETVCMRPGDVWWFEGSQVHSVQNQGARDRLHLILDCHIGGETFIPAIQPRQRQRRGSRGSY